MEKLDLIQALGNATCARGLLDAHACTVTEAWNFGALVLVGAAVSIVILLLRERSRQRRENEYY
jgi:hypothetical protein